MLDVVRAALVLVLAVGQLELLFQRQHERVREGRRHVEPPRDCSLVGRRRGERLCRQLPPRLEGQFPVALQLLEDMLAASKGRRR